MSTQQSGTIRRKNADGSVSTIVNGVEILRERFINPNDKFIEL